MLPLWLPGLNYLPQARFRTREQGGDLCRPNVIQPQKEVLWARREGRWAGKASALSSLQLQKALQSCRLTAADVAS